jgi:hypothetical protein
VRDRLPVGVSDQVAAPSCRRARAEESGAVRLPWRQPTPARSGPARRASRTFDVTW